MRDYSSRGQGDYNRRNIEFDPESIKDKGGFARSSMVRAWWRGIAKNLVRGLKMERGRSAIWVAIYSRRFSVNDFSEFFIKTGVGVRVCRREWDREESQGGVSGEEIVNSHVGKSPEESRSCSRLQRWWVSSTKRRGMSYTGRKKEGKWSSLHALLSLPFQLLFLLWVFLRVPGILDPGAWSLFQQAMNCSPSFTEHVWKWTSSCCRRQQFVNIWDLFLDWLHFEGY